MKLFDKLYNAKKEVLAEAKRPGTRKKVKRGFESAIDSLEDKIIDLEGEKVDMREKVANGDASLIKDLSFKRIEIDDLNDQIKALKAEREEFFEVEVEESTEE